MQKLSINIASDWQVIKKEIESSMKRIGEYPRVVRSRNTNNGEFTAVVLEGGLNIKYNLLTGKVLIWGVGKRRSNGFIDDRVLFKKVEEFKKIMQGVCC